MAKAVDLHMPLPSFILNGEIVLLLHFQQPLSHLVFFWIFGIENTIHTGKTSIAVMKQKLRKSNQKILRPFEEFILVKVT